MSCDFTRGIQNKYTNADGTRATGVGSTLLQWLYHIICIIFYKAIFTERKYIHDVEFSHHEMRVFRLERDRINNNNGGSTGKIKTRTYINNIILLLYGNPTAKLQHCIAKFVCGTTEGYTCAFLRKCKIIRHSSYNNIACIYVVISVYQ